MTITDNSSDNLDSFGDLAEGQVFKDEDGNMYMKTELSGTHNAVNLSTGALTTVLDSSLVGLVNATLNVSNYVVAS